MLKKTKKLQQAICDGILTPYCVINCCVTVEFV